MKTKSPPVIGPMDFMGLEGKLILIQFDDWRDFVHAIPKDRPTIIITPSADHAPAQHSDKLDPDTAIIDADKIQKICKGIFDSAGININYIINRIDLMDLDITPLNRGWVRKGNLMKLTERVLKGSNIFITSESDEPMLEEMCDKRYDLRSDFTMKFRRPE